MCDFFMRIYNLAIVIAIIGTFLCISCVSCKSKCQITDHIVICNQLSKGYGVILNNSENLTMDEIYTAEMIYFGYLSNNHNKNKTLDDYKKFYKKFYRQYCKKTIEDEIILFINYIILDSSEKSVFASSSEPFVVLSEPDNSSMINDFCYINLTKQHVCNHLESKTISVRFWQTHDCYGPTS